MAFALPAMANDSAALPNTGSYVIDVTDYNYYYFKVGTKEISKTSDWKAIDGKISLGTATSLDGNRSFADFSKIANKTGTLYLSNFSGTPDGTMTSILERYAFSVADNTFKPKVGTAPYLYEDNFLLVPNDILIAPVGSNAFASISSLVNGRNIRASGSSIAIMAQPYKQDFLVRKDDTKSAKLSVAAQAAPPALKVNTARGQIGMKKNWEIDVGDGWVKVPDTVKFLTVSASGTSLAGTADWTIGYQDDLKVRVAATEKRPASVESELVWDLFRVADDVDVSMFANGLNNRTNVLGGRIIEAFIDNKWKKLKVIPADLDGTTPIRVAGNKYTFPSSVDGTAIWGDFKSDGVGVGIDNWQ